MCRSAEQCAERVADRENLVRELVEALEGLADEAAGSVEYSDWPELQEAVERARAVICRAKDQQGE